MIGLVALDKNGTVCEDMRWFDIPEVVNHFKSTTSGVIVIAGRDTYETINELLTDRTIVVTRDSSYRNEKAVVCNELKELYTKCLGNMYKTMVVGGAELYKLLERHIDALIVVELDKECQEGHKIDLTKFSLDSEKETENSQDIRYKLKFYVKG